MTTTPRRAPKPAPPPSPEAELTPGRLTIGEPEIIDLHGAFLAWQRHGPDAVHSAATLSDLLTLARSLNDYGLTLRHQLIDCEAATRIEAIISRGDDWYTSGPLPLPIQATAADFIQARILTTELVLGIAKEEAAAATTEEVFIAVKPTPEPDAAPTAAPVEAPKAEIDALRLQIEALPPDWITYITEAFRAQFGLPADHKISPAIKSTEHLAFIRSILPSQAA
jgi:hypothetical protein